MKKYIYLTLGHFFLVLALVGAALPLLPTTPFLLLTAYFYSKGSQRFYSWLINHRVFGQAILDWREHGVIRAKIKVISVASITVGFGLSFYLLNVPAIAKWLLGIVGGLVISFIITRPSEMRRSGQTQVKP